MMTCVNIFYNKDYYYYYYALIVGDDNYKWSFCFVQDKCLEDRQCGKGRFCDMHYGVCRPEKSPGFACRRDRMCAKGLHCMYGRCQAKIPSGEEGIIEDQKLCLLLL